jgi:hypothetical protein
VHASIVDTMYVMPPRARPLSERFWPKVDRRDPDECWPWLGAVNKQTRYGQIFDGRVMIGAHRAAYMLEVGPIAEGMTLDHICNVRTCVNPAHLNPCTTQVNTQLAVTRRDTCRRGHPRQSNSYIDPKGTVRCRPCNTLKAQEYRARKTS